MAVVDRPKVVGYSQCENAGVLTVMAVCGAN